MPHHTPMTKPRIAIIGAGMAGISCASVLQQRGLPATLFEKSRGLGGRLATRRNEAGESFDHGAQYITTQSPEFSAFIDARHGEGAAATWQPRISDEAARHHHPWLVGTPGMNALLKPLARSLDIRLDATVTALRRQGRQWQLHTADSALPDLFDVVICTAPVAQTHKLLAVEPSLQKQLESVTMAPCWALMISFAAPLDVDFDARRFNDDDAAAWLARQGSRPGHVEGRNAWVMHASPRWSAEHLELTPEQAITVLQQHLSRVLGRELPANRFAQTHRWRYAMTVQPLGQPFLANAEQNLFAGGDWCLGARVECAYQSGVTIATAVAKKLGG